jgi:hypothetical protein
LLPPQGNLEPAKCADSASTPCEQNMKRCVIGAGRRPRRPASGGRRAACVPGWTRARPRTPWRSRWRPSCGRGGTSAAVAPPSPSSC